VSAGEDSASAGAEPAIDGTYVVSYGGQRGTAIASFTKDHRFDASTISDSRHVTGTFRYHTGALHLVEDVTGRETVWPLGDTAKAGSGAPGEVSSPTPRTVRGTRVNPLDTAPTPLLEGDGVNLLDPETLLAAAVDCAKQIGLSSIRPLDVDTPVASGAPSAARGLLCGLFPGAPSPAPSALLRDIRGQQEDSERPRPMYDGASFEASASRKRPRRASHLITRA